MATLTIRNLDPRVYERLKERARASKRSLESEARMILEKAADHDREEFARFAAELRARIGTYEGDTTQEIRDDRDSR